MIENLSTDLYQYNFWGQLFTVIAILMLIFYIYVISAVLRNNFKNKHPSRWNLLLAEIGLLVIAILFGLALINPEVFDPLMPYPFNYYLLVFWLIWFIVCFVSNEFVRNYRRIFHRPEKDPNRIEKKYNVEVQRKIVHVMAWIILLTFYISPYLFTLVNTYVYVPNADIYASEILYNMNVVSNLHNLPITYYAAIPVLFLVLMAALFVQIDAELFFNMWPDYYFPFKKTLSISLREEEKGSLGTHVHMILGYVMALVILTYDRNVSDMGLVINCLFALILSTIFGDLAAAAFGKTWGKKKWKSYPSKSYVGSIAGMIVTFCMTFWFVGIPMALIATVIFLISDIPLSKIKICDNLSYPILFAVILRICWIIIIPFGIVL